MKKASILLCMFIVVITWGIYFILPPVIPIHFNGLGEIDNYGDRALIFIPALLAFLASASIILFSKTDLKKANFKRFEKPFYTLIFLINFIMFLLILLIMIVSIYF